ncbi:MAG TPA: hypothetical protein DDY86_03595 [Syntrophaceae bacterium]|nr:hypothetical protein [Syntrophaceae bacterium]
MRIYCLTCREVILETTDAFILGGPYDGGMFKGVRNDNWAETMFRTHPDVKGGNLFCPRCTGRFLGADGGLLTEHGIIRPGQRTVDTEYSIVHQDGPAKGLLMCIAPSLEKAVVEPDPVVVVPEAEPETLECPKCGKAYKNTEAGRPWYERHIERCDG